MNVSVHLQYSQKCENQNIKLTKINIKQTRKGIVENWKLKIESWKLTSIKILEILNQKMQ